MSIVPLGINRVSIPLQQNRAYGSLQSAQSLLAKYEQQIMTQRQYQYGSDSPYNATATLNVQSQVERKTQNAANIKTTLSYLSATDSTLSQFGALTNDARSAALDAINTATSASQRTALAQTVNQTLQQVFNFGNYSYNGRYVFSGSTTAVTPFEWGTDAYTVTYRGSASDVYSWSDTDILSQTNMNGVEVFGAISDPVRGDDLDPSLTATTLLADLNGGKGVDKGSIRLTYEVGNKSYAYDVDLSKCVTLADVKKTLENFQNPHFTLNVEWTDDGLTISLPPETAGSVTISEIGKGKIARQLGLSTSQRITAETPLQGRDLNPIVKTTTSLDNILGSRASTTLRFAGSNNDIVLQATTNGETYVDADGNSWPLNGVSVELQAETDVAPGSEYAEYDPETQRILVHIHPDNTSANDIIRAINDAAVAGTIPPFEASLSGLDQTRADLAGTGLVTLLPGMFWLEGVTEGGSGVDFDRSGVEIVNGNVTYNISFEHCATIGDVLAELNDPQYGLYATINASGTGIDVSSRVSGADFCIGERGGSSASQLGIRTTDVDTLLSEFDYGRGVTDYDGPGTPATAAFSSVTPNSSLLLTAKNEGTAWNDYTLNFVPTTDPQGEVVVSMDEEAKTITIGVNPGTTTACQIVEAFNAQPGPQQYFTLELDTTDGVNTGAGVVYDGFVKTAGGSDGGIDFTITRNDGTVLEIDIHGAETLGDVLKIINEHPDNRDGLLVASLAKNGNGIELTDTSFGSSVTRVDRTLLSTTAVELGLVEMGEEYRTKTEVGLQATATVGAETLNGALLVTAKSVGTYANDVSIQFVEGTPPGFAWDAASKTMTFSIEPGVTTANDIVEIFQSRASETVRSMFDIQNGTNPDGSTSDGSATVALGAETLTGGTDALLKGDDPNPKETESIYNALIRLQVAMEKDDTREIERATQLLDDAVQRVTDARATIGLMQTSLDSVSARLAEEYVQHEETLNNTLRIDYADASISYLAQQLSYQASMQVATALFQMSLLNYF